MNRKDPSPSPNESESESSAGRLAPYDRLIDKEMWSFIDTTNSYFSKNAMNLSLLEQRELYNTMSRGFHAGRPKGVDSRDYEVGQPLVKVREYRSVDSNFNDEAVVIYYHGGGFVVGNLETHDDVCSEICAATGFNVIAVDYRLAPEHPHPASFDDAYSVFESVSQSCTKRIVLVGDSAGANLAAAISAKTRMGNYQPAGQVLVYPYLGGPLDTGSAIEHAEAPMLKTRDLDFYRQARIPVGQTEEPDETFAPLTGKDYQALPATVVFSAECDPVCDDGELYAQAINDTPNGRATWILEKGMVHGYQRARHVSAKASAAFERILKAIENLGRGQWPYSA